MNDKSKPRAVSKGHKLLQAEKFLRDELPPDDVAMWKDSDDPEERLLFELFRPLDTKEREQLLKPFRTLDRGDS